MTHPLAGQPAPASSLTDIPALLAAYRNPPDPADPAQRVAFGTSGHRGSALAGSFNEAHVLAITQATALVATESHAARSFKKRAPKKILITNARKGSAGTQIS